MRTLTVTVTLTLILTLTLTLTLKPSSPAREGTKARCHVTEDARAHAAPPPG